MNDAELDGKLKKGAGQARRFFNGRFDVHESADTVIGRSGRLSLRARAWRKTCLAGACVMAAAAVCAAVVFALDGRGTGAVPQQTDALSEQTVCLSDDKEYRMNYIPVDMQSDGGGLMTVLRETGGGDAPVAYYSLFEACDTVYPALILPFPESDYDMLLIASGDSRLHNLGYRLVGYSDDMLTTWWTEDGVPDGLLSVYDGVAVEHRTTGNATCVTYIVPVQTAGPGRIALPVETLSMAVGERILLIGAGNVDASSESGLLAAEEQEESGVAAVLLKALWPGKDVVSVGSKEDARTISVDIGE